MNIHIYIMKFRIRSAYRSVKMLMTSFVWHYRCGGRLTALSFVKHVYWWTFKKDSSYLLMEQVS